MSQRLINERLELAFKKLFTLKALKKPSLTTSRYDFGIETEEQDMVYDRCHVDIKIKPDSFLTCQIIFDSRNYNFPPDIVFHQLPKDIKSNIDDMTTLLPDKEEWNVDSVDCLYQWFERILKILVKEEEKEPEKNWSLFKDEKEAKNKKLGIFDDDDDDDFEAPLNTSSVKNPVNRKPSLPDIEFIDDDYYKYKSSCEVIDTTEDIDDDDDTEMLDITMEEDKVKSSKPFGSYRANMAGLAKKSSNSSTLKSSCVELDDDMDDSIFDFPSEPPAQKRSLLKRSSLASPKKQTVLSSMFTSPNRSSESTPMFTSPKRSSESASMFTSPKRSSESTSMFTSPKRSNESPSQFKSPNRSLVEKKRRTDVVDLIFDDTDDFDNTPPPAKLRKTAASPKLFDLNSKPKHTRLASGDLLNRKFTKKFFTTWLSTYQNYIISYDAERFRYFTFFFTFKILKTDPSWQKYIKKMQVKLAENSPESFLKPKQQAPVIVYFKMDDQFPSTDLRIKVISVVNTDKRSSSEPECMDITFNVDRDVDPSKTMEALMSLLEERVPAFHCQLYEDIV